MVSVGAEIWWLFVSFILIAQAVYLVFLQGRLCVAAVDAGLFVVVHLHALADDIRRRAAPLLIDPFDRARLRRDLELVPKSELVDSLEVALLLHPV